MSFADFPSEGHWQINFYDDNDIPTVNYSQHVYCTEYLDDYYLMRRRSEHGWDFHLGEREHKLVQLQNGNWTMGWMSSIIITDAFQVNGVLNTCI